MHERVIIQRMVTQIFKKYHENNKGRFREQAQNCCINFLEGQTNSKVEYGRKRYKVMRNIIKNQKNMEKTDLTEVKKHHE